MTPDLSFNIIHTIYSIYDHNYVVLAYFAGLLLSIYLSIKHPTRNTVFLLLGFALLTFSFEYDKHIIDGLRAQTLQSLITTKPHYTVQKWVNLFLGDILPVFFYLTGWGLVFTAIFMGNRHPQSASKQ